MIRNLETIYVSSKTNSRWVNNERDIPPIIKLTLPLDLRFLPLSSVFTFLSLLSYLSRKIQKAQFDHLQLFENNARKQMDSWGFIMFRLNQIYKNCKIERDRKIEIGYIYIRWLSVLKQKDHRLPGDNPLVLSYVIYVVILVTSLSPSSSASYISFVCSLPLKIPLLYIIATIVACSV